MSMRLVAVLFTALFLIGAFPVLFLQPFGFASAGVTTGFLSSIENAEHVAVLAGVGVLSAWCGGEAVLLLPLCTLLMFVIGALSELSPHSFHALHAFVLGAIILFSLSASLMRNPLLFVYTALIAVWAYFSGDNFTQTIPPIATPLFFILGLTLSSALVLAMGVAAGSIFFDDKRPTPGKPKAMSAFMVLSLSL